MIHARWVFDDECHVVGYMLDVLVCQLSSADSYNSVCHSERAATQGHRYRVRTQPLTPYEHEYNAQLDVYQLPCDRP